MCNWDWEVFDKIVTSSMFSITDCGPLRGPVRQFEIERDEELDLVLKTTSAFDSTSDAVARPAGAVYRSEETVRFEGRDGAVATANGVISMGYRQSWSVEDNSSMTRETAKLASVEWVPAQANGGTYLIEWLSNMGTFQWPHTDGLEEVTTRRRTLNGGDRTVVMSDEGIRGSKFGFSCVQLTVDGIQLFVGSAEKEGRMVRNPGFILYCGVPEECTRRKLREVISFCLGCYLIYLGCSEFDSEWNLVRFQAWGGGALVKEAPRLRGWEPSPLGVRFEGEITSAPFARMVSALYTIYDEFDFQAGYWNYWHALAAPVHMQAVHFGAAIEGLQHAMEQNSGRLSKRIIDCKSDWEELQNRIFDVIRGSEIGEGEKELFVRKVSGLNNVPQGMLMERFCSAIGLSLSEFEGDVWANRNRAAHGGGIRPGGEVRLVRENKVLHTMLNRIILGLGKEMDCYYDFYTLGRPVRSLVDGVPYEEE